MSATGLDVFDRTLQITNIWLNEIMEAVGPDRRVAWKVLSVVLHKLRDRLPVELAANLGAELPLLVRGVYYDQYQPKKQPADWRTLEDFTHEVQKWLADTRPVDAKDAIEAVFATLNRHLPEGMIEKIKQALPQPIHASWDAADRALPRGPKGADGAQHPARI